MKTMSQLACLLVIAVTSTAHAEDAKPKPAVKIVNETKVFKLDDSRDRRENAGMHSMCLSPDATTLLYVQRIPPAAKPGGDAPQRRRRGYRLVLRNIKTGKDTVMPGAPSGSDDFLVAYVSMRPFDAAGKSIVIPVGLGPADEPLRPGKGQMQLGIYNLAAGKLKKLDLTAAIIFPSYDAEGKNLIVLAMSLGDQGPDMALSKIVISPADKIKFKQIGITGMPRGPCPGGIVLPVLLPPNRNQPNAPRRGTFVLYDTKSDKQLLMLPQSGTKLDDYNPQWTADGRYLYYADYGNDPVRKSMKGGKRITRIWDRKKAVERPIIEGAVPIGPAPGKSEMILMNREKGSCWVHNTATGKDSPLPGGIARLINADGRFILYVKQDKDSAKSVYRAEMK